MKIAAVIFGQLGGNRFTVMTGAKNFVGSDEGLTFRIPKAKNGINCVRIILTPADLYKVEFMKIRGTTVKTHEIVSNVYAENLRSVFEDHTGLATSL